MNQRGFVMTGMLWGAVAAGAIILSLTGALYVQTLRVGKCKAEAALFKTQTEALGKAAKREADDQRMRDKLRLEKANEENASATDDLRAQLDAARKRLRDERARGSPLSAPAPSAASPDRTSFDPTLLAGAIQRFDEGIRRFEDGVLGIIESCSKAVVDLDTAKKWAPPKVE